MFGADADRSDFPRWADGESPFTAPKLALRLASLSGGRTSKPCLASASPTTAMSFYGFCSTPTDASQARLPMRSAMRAWAHASDRNSASTRTITCSMASPHVKSRKLHLASGRQ
jgi:hypothetical protein